MKSSVNSFRSKLGSIVSQQSKESLLQHTLPTICVTSESQDQLNEKPSKEESKVSEKSSRERESLGFNLKQGDEAKNDYQSQLRKLSAQFADALKNQEEDDSYDEDFLRLDVSPSDPQANLLSPNYNFRNRRGVTGSISIPMNKMAVKLYGSKKAVLDEQKRLKQAGNWIIHPYSNFRLLWDSLTLVLLLINIILIPVAIAFWKDGESSWLPFKYVTDVWFLLDIFFNFRTGIVMDGPDSEVVLNPRKIRTLYLETWFLIDLVSTFPFDLMFTLINSVTGDPNSIHEPKLKALNLFRLAKILALLRLLRLSRFIRYMKQWEEIFNFQYELALAFARIINLVMLMLFICHFNGCLQYMVPMFLNFPEKTWVRERNLNAINVTIWERYSWSVFKSTSHMLCIGYGLFPPKALVDVWVTYVSMLSGAMCFALFIGNATSLIQSMDASKRAYKEKFMQVKEYMQFRKLPPTLRKKISDYYENRFQGKMFDEKKILSELNHNLREQVINSNCRDLIEQVPLFSEADPYFMNALMAKLEFEVFLVDETIVREGTYGNKMYFISQGTVLIHSDQHNFEQQLSDGAYFGEIAMLQPHLRRVASVTADTYSYLYSLSADDFNDVLNAFPMQKSRLSKFLPLLNQGKASTVGSVSFSTPSDTDDEKLVKISLEEISEESSGIWEEDD